MILFFVKNETTSNYDRASDIDIYMWKITHACNKKQAKNQVRNDFNRFIAKLIDKNRKIVILLPKISD